jgi:hypothetical protein
VALKNIVQKRNAGLKAFCSRTWRLVVNRSRFHCTLLSVSFSTSQWTSWSLPGRYLPDIYTVLYSSRSVNSLRPQYTFSTRESQMIAVRWLWRPDIFFLPGVLRHAVKLRTSTAGYIAERAYRSRRAFVYLKHAGKLRLWLAAFTWGSDRIDLGAMSPAVSLERSFATTETAGYLAWGRMVHLTTEYLAPKSIASDRLSPPLTVKVFKFTFSS